VVDIYPRLAEDKNPDKAKSKELREFEKVGAAGKNVIDVEDRRMRRPRQDVLWL
jgi:hypothetical protein